MARLISQHRGAGGPTYRKINARKHYTLRYSKIYNRDYEIVKILHDPARSAPLLKIKYADGTYDLALGVEGVHVGQMVTVGNKGYVTELKNLAPGTSVCNIEIKPLDGGKILKSSGSYGEIFEQMGKYTIVKKGLRKIKICSNCFATIGIPGGAGRSAKPLLKAGLTYYKYKAKASKYPHVSRVAMNHHEHPFGSSGPKKPGRPKHSGRGYPPGAKVGAIAPRRQGYER